MSDKADFHVDTHAGFDETPDLVGIGIRALTRQAIRLGIQWRLRLATVTEAIDLNKMTVLLDGDEGPLTVVSMVGPATVGARVYVLSIPPAGNYVIGSASFNFPGQRIATVTRTTASGSFTAETVIDTIVAPLVVGKRYKIHSYTQVQSTVADGFARGRIREDSITGTHLTIRQVPTTIAANQGILLILEGEYTAVRTGDKTFVVTMTRQAGTGNLSSFANSDSPTITSVDYVSG